jgi:hypothetical protein
MKKILVVALVAMFLFCGFAQADTESWKPGKTIAADYTASQTGGTVATITTGKKAIITDIVISSVTSGTVYLFDDTDAAAYKITPTLALGNYGTYVSAFKNPFVTSGVSHVIKYTSGSGATGSIWLHYVEE